MRSTASLLLAGLLVCGTAACSGDDSADTAAPSASPPAGTTATPAPETTTAAPSASPGAAAPTCVRGAWRATGVTASGGIGAVGGHLTGGAGTTMSVGPDGTTEVGFTESGPLAFSAQAAGATIKGQIQYSGSMHGMVQFVPGTAAGTGSWKATVNGNSNDLRATVKLSEPVSVTLLDNAAIDNLAGDELSHAADALDVQPILRGGTYRCNADTLRVQTTANGPNLSWTFARA